jgi:hypothetical protein
MENFITSKSKVVERRFGLIRGGEKGEEELSVTDPPVDGQ